MLHLMKYQFKQTVREVSIMFWALVFPIILGIFFYVSFGNSDMGENMEMLPVAVVETENTDSEEPFLEYLNHLDGDIIEVKVMKAKKAIKALEEDEVEGIFYAGEEPELTVAKSEIEQSILKSLLDTYQKNAKMIVTVAEHHPEKLNEAMDELGDWRETTEEVSVGGRTMNPNITYFFALIAYACLSGAFLGVKGCCDSQANLSPLGARQCITPTHKMRMLLSVFLVLFGIHFVNIMVLTAFVRFVLGIDLGGNPGGIILINLMGSMIGVSAGILLGSVSRLSFGVKMGFTVMVTLVPGFFAGLMFGDMKNILEQHAPIVNRLNPAAVLSDSYYCMAVFNDAARMNRNLLTLFLMSAGFVLVAFLVTRRERYDSI